MTVVFSLITLIVQEKRKASSKDENIVNRLEILLFFMDRKIGELFRFIEKGSLKIVNLYSKLIVVSTGGKTT